MTSNSVNESLVSDLQMSIKSKNLDRVQSILKSISQDDLNGIRFNDLHSGLKWTPLGYAIHIGFVNCVQLLLDYGSDPNMYTLFTLRHMEAVSLPLLTAIRKGDTETFELLLNCHNIDVNRADVFGQTPELMCVIFRREDYLQMIIGHKDFKLKTLRTDPFCYSSSLLNKGRLKCFKILINSGFKVNQYINYCVIKSGNQTALKMIEMSTGKTLTSEGYKVPTLLQLTRIMIRDNYVQNSGRPLIISNIEKCFPEIPHNLKYFLTDFCQTF